MQLTMEEKKRWEQHLQYSKISSTHSIVGLPIQNHLDQLETILQAISCKPSKFFKTSHLDLPGLNTITRNHLIMYLCDTGLITKWSNSSANCTYMRCFKPDKTNEILSMIKKKIIMVCD